MALERFHAAQDGGGMYAAALAEITAGRKEGHWIWYILPQLAVLGRSETARYYGIADVEEAQAYYRDPVLGPRLLAVVAAIVPHVQAGTALVDMFGHTDALKTISCLTLFRGLRVEPANAPPWHAEFCAAADVVLAAGAREGIPPCAVTQGVVGGGMQPPVTASSCTRCAIRRIMTSHGNRIYTLC